MIDYVPLPMAGRVSNRRVSYGAFILSVLLTFTAGFFLLQQLRAQAQLRGAAYQSLALVNQLNDVFATLQSAEMGQRGYILTSDPQHLFPYEQAVQTIPAKLDALKAMIDDDSPIEQDFRKFLPLVLQKLTELHDTIELRRTQPDESALALADPGVSKIMMDQIHDLIETMKTTADSQLTLREASVVQSEQRTVVFTAVLALFSLVTLGGVVVLLNREISSQRVTEESLYRTQSIVRQLWDMSPTILYFYSLKDERRLVMNHAAAEFLGSQAEPARPSTELISRVLDEHLHSDDREERQRMSRDLANTVGTEVVKGEIRLLNYASQWRWLYCCEAVFRRDAAGQPVEVVGTALDMTDRKLLQEQETHRAALLRSFIENMSHDMNTPITILSTSLDLMKRYSDILDNRLTQLTDGAATLDQMAPEMTNLLQRNRRKVQDLDMTVGILKTRVADMLEMVRLEQEAELHCTSTDLNQLVEQTTMLFSSHAEERRVRLSFRPLSPSVTVNVDEEKLMRALGNVILNAIHYNHPDGTVDVRVGTDDQDVVIEVVDSGIGIAEDDLPRVFERFFRADKARSLDTGGTGLGLTMTRQIVELHGGSLTLTSRLDVGTTARLVLPASVVVTAPPSGQAR